MKNIQQKKKTIVVPQGYSGRLELPESTAVNLYTDGISVCNVLVITGTDQEGKIRLSLIHVDFLLMSDPELIQQEIDWARGKKGKNILLQAFYKEEGGTTIHELLKKNFQDKGKFESLMISKKEQQTGVSGVSVTVEKDKPIVAKRKDILELGDISVTMHPDYPQLELTRKLSQLFGKREQQTTGKHPAQKSKKIHIFDGINWESFTDAKDRLALDTSHKLTQAEMKLFDDVKNFNDILLHVTKLANEWNLQTRNTILHTPYDCLLYAIAVETLLLPKLYPGETPWCQAYLKNIQDVKKFISYSHELLKEEFTESYHLRCAYYGKLETDKTKEKNLCLSYIQKGLIAFQKSDFLNARAYFKEALNLTEKHYSKTDIALSKAYYNYGRTLFKCGDATSAIPLLERSLELKKAIPLYLETELGKKDIEKTQNALNEAQASSKEEKGNKKVLNPKKK